LKRTKPGTLNKKITIEQPTYAVSDDTNDKYISAWATYKTCWASLVHKQSQEVFESGQMVAKDTFEWKIWYNEAQSITQDMRIKWSSEYYYIIGIKKLFHETLGYVESYLITTILRDNG